MRTKRDGSVPDAFKCAVVTRERQHLRCAVCAWHPPYALAGRLWPDDSPAWRDVQWLMHAHHVVPVCCGGPDDFHNLVVLCPNHHAIAHRAGRIVRHAGRVVWRGPTSPAQLVADLQLLDRDPAEWLRRLSRY